MRDSSKVSSKRARADCCTTLIASASPTGARLSLGVVTTQEGMGRPSSVLMPEWEAQAGAAAAAAAAASAAEGTAGAAGALLRAAAAPAAPRLLLLLLLLLALLLSLLLLAVAASALKQHVCRATSCRKVSHTRVLAG